MRHPPEETGELIGRGVACEINSSSIHLQPKHVIDRH
jgi:hypothetical protein